MQNWNRRLARKHDCGNTGGRVEPVSRWPGRSHFRLRPARHRLRLLFALTLLGSVGSAVGEEEGDPRVKVPDAERTIALTMPAFRRCFESMNASGRVALVMTIIGDGAVSSARVEGPVPRPVAECIRRHALRTVFSEPEGGRTARLFVPFSYIRQYG